MCVLSDVYNLDFKVRERALEVWGSEDGIEEAKQKRQDNKEKLKQRKYDKKVKGSLFLMHTRHIH